MTTAPTPTPVRRQARNRTTGSGDQRGFYQDVAQAGATPDVSTTITTAPAPDHAVEALGIDAATPVLTRSRVMATEAGILQLATTYFAPSVAAEIPRLAEQDTGSGGMYARLEEAGHEIAGNQSEVVTARRPTAEEAAALGLTDEWVIVLRRVTRNQHDAALEYTDVVAHPLLNAFEYQV